MDNIYKKDEKVIVTKLGDEYVVYPNPESEKNSTYVCMLDEFANEIFQKLDGSKSINKIIEDITNEYDTDREIIKKDITEFIDQLLDANLIYICKGKE